MATARMQFAIRNATNFTGPWLLGEKDGTVSPSRSGGTATQISAVTDRAIPAVPGRTAGNSCGVLTRLCRRFLERRVFGRFGSFSDVVHLDNLALADLIEADQQAFRKAWRGRSPL